MTLSQLFRALPALLAAIVLGACQVPPPETQPFSESHLGNESPAASVSSIPEPVRQAPFLPLPKPEAPSETYTVVVSEVPVKELLFALARDAGVNIDVSPRIDGNVTLNAVEQSLDQILDRIARQVSLRYEHHDDTLVVLPDEPYLKTYRVDYVNVQRDSNGRIGSSALVGDASAQSGAEGNTSENTILSTSNNRFWTTLAAALEELVRPTDDTAAGPAARVIPNPEAGVVTVRGSASQHALVQSYIDLVMASATRQVLIEATIVEVTLNDRYQAGINWQVFTRNGGIGGSGITLGTDVGSAFSTITSGGVSGLILNAADAATGSTKRTIEASLRLLNEFGDTQVLSSPKIMTLNNQPAVLKVVDNEIYFDLDFQTSQNQTQTTTTAKSQVRSVAVGLVMTVTPQISAGDTVTLNVRPSITRVREFKEDPATQIALASAAAGGAVLPAVSNQVPVIQTRESEAVMRVSTGQLAILGGLMQDRVERRDRSVPGVSDVPGLGELFKYRDRPRGKTELVVFIRPTVIRSPDVGADLAQFRRYLPANLGDTVRQVSPLDSPQPGENP